MKKSNNVRCANQMKKGRKGGKGGKFRLELKRGKRKKMVEGVHQSLGEGGETDLKYEGYERHRERRVRSATARATK